jgi:hypothetical protein
MSRGLSRTFGVIAMMTVMMGVTGPLNAATGPGSGGMCVASAAPPAQAPRAHSIHDVIFQMREASDGSAVVTAVSAEVTFKKVVYPDGRTEATFEKGRDRVTVVTTTAGVTVSRGAAHIAIEHTGVTDEALGRVRTTWATSPALRAFRAMAAAIEDEDDVTSPERLAVWLTGALVAQVDGDDSAVTRLARKMRRTLTGPERKVSTAAAVDCWSIYANAVVRAAQQLEECYRLFSIWDPRRHGCSFIWTLQVEGAWFGYLSCSSFPWPK